MNHKRYNIGFLFGDFYGAYTANLFYNIINSCREYGQNFTGFGGGFLKSTAGPVLGENCNFIYDLPGPDNVDGIIVEGSIGNFIPEGSMQEFLLKYQGIPIINIGSLLEGYNNILIDNKKGMTDLVNHLVEYHNYKNIAFITGNEGNFDSIERFESYKNVLEKHGIAFNKDLVAPGDFSYQSGTKAFETLFNERKVKFDAVVCSNDYMAINVMREMKRYGLKVPDYAAVTGFDDTQECWTAKPTLTTVKQPFYELGRTAVKLLLSMMEGKNPPSKTVIPTEFIIRESCGCRASDKLNFIMNEKFMAGAPAPLELDKDVFKHDIAGIMKRELPYLSSKIDLKKHLTALIDRYCEAVADGGNKSALLDEFLCLFRILLESNEEIITVYQFISIFYGSLLNRYLPAGERDNCRQLWNETQALFGLLIKEEESEKMALLTLESHVVFDVTESFINTFDIDKLKEAVLSTLPPQFHFESFYACLFEDKTRQLSRVLFAYDKDNGRISLDPFPSKNLLPVKTDNASPHEYVVMALYFKMEYFGYLLFDIQTATSYIYETLSVQISGAIKGARLTNELYMYANQLEHKVRERTSELEKANTKLKDLDVLKNDFIANITHDFRSPLTVILNAADLALHFDETISEDSKDKFQMIYKSSLRLKDTIDKLLELAKIDARGITLRIEKVDIAANLNSLLDYYESSVSASGIKIQRKLPEKAIEDFYTDSEKLEEILDNILSNAVKFVNPGTGIISVMLEEDEEHVKIMISDNGIGIPPDKLDVIFNRFEQLQEGRNNRYHGTGIGLAFSKQLADFLKAEIWAESEGDGKGSKFTVRLKKGAGHFNRKDFSRKEAFPRNKTDIKTLIQSDLEEKMHNNNIKTIFQDLNGENGTDYKRGIILIIDDDRNICEIIYKYLLNNGFKNFIIASDGKQGLEALYEYSPDIVICDYNMPNMKGDDLHNRLINNPVYKEIPFIFLSAVADNSLMLERRELGAAAFLKKPIEEKLFIITVEEQLIKYYELKKIKRMATRDELTGLNNRKTILENLKRELSIRQYRDISVIFLDIDHFKNINDTYGHQAGDLLLSSAGKTIKSFIRKYDIAGRYGGDEFLIILPDTNLKNAVYTAEMLRKTLGDIKFRYGKNVINVTTSSGVASLKDNEKYIRNNLGIKSLPEIFEVADVKGADWENIEETKDKISELLVKMADRALYKAKAGRNAVAGFTSGRIDT